METVFKPAIPTALPVKGTSALFPVRRVYCVGQNYADHAREMGSNPNAEPPFFFSKPSDALVTIAEDNVPFPPKTKDLHHEVELVVAIGKGGFNIKTEDAHHHIFGYAVGVDLTRRDVQALAKSKGRPWDLSKGFDHSAPIGLIIPVAESGLLTKGGIELSVNGDLRQKGDLNNMIWDVASVIAYLSSEIELKAGDLIYTGTPAGVSALQIGDKVTAKIQGLGERSFMIG